MKKIVILAFFISLCWQSFTQNDTIFVMKNGNIIHQIPVNQIDSFIFYHPTIPVVTFTDARDGNIYPMITIGTQVWMGANLAYLPSVNPPTVGSNTNSFYYVDGYYGSDVNAAKLTSNYSTYGVLYNWPAAMTACPTGWHLPSDAEWTILTTFLGGETIAGGKLKEVGTVHWTSPNTSATNDYNYTALPNGQRDYFNSVFNGLGTYSLWWSSTEYTSDTSYGRQLVNNLATIFRGHHYKGYGNAVRCIQN